MHTLSLWDCKHTTRSNSSHFPLLAAGLISSWSKTPKMEEWSLLAFHSLILWGFDRICKKRYPKWQTQLLRFHWKRSYTDWTYVKGTTCFIDKDASQMIECCETKQGLSCFCLLPTGSLRGVSALPGTTGQTATLEKTACCLFSYLKVQITANSGLPVGL